MNKEYKLEENDILVARALLKVFKDEIQSKKVVTTYEHISDMVDRKVSPENLRHPFDKISKLCHDILDLPFISAIVVSQNSAKSGKGFYEMIEEKGYITDEQQNLVIQKARDNKDWSKLEKYLDDNYGKN